MAHVRKGQLTDINSPADWWKHLRQWKRAFWKRERRAARRDAASQAADH